MADQYGTKTWARWASQNLEVVLALLEEPYKQWDKQMGNLERAKKTLNVIKTELKKARF